MAFQCEKCGKDTPFKELAAPEILTEKHLQLCAGCRQLESNRQFLVGVVIAVVVLLGFYGWRRFSPDSFWPCFLWNLLLIQLFQYISTIPHEVGHALAAKLLGTKVERIVIGNGRVLSTFKIGGFQFDFCSQPFGGAMYPGRMEIKGWRWRGAVIWAAGPLANVIFGLLALSWMPDRATARFDFGGEVSCWLLFIIANAILALTSLIPMVITSRPQGAIPNDGMALVQLIFEGKWPYVPVQPSHVLAIVEPRSLRVFKIFFAMMFVILGTLLILLSIAYLVSGMGREDEGVKHLLVSAALVGGAGAIFGLTFRMMRPSPLPAIEPAKNEELKFQVTISEADWNKNKWPANISPPVLLHNISLLYSSGQFAQGLQEVDEVLEREPDNFWLLLCKADFLAAQKRFEEAEVCTRSAIDRPDFESGTRMFLTMRLLQLWAQQEKKEQVKAKVAEVIVKDFSVDEKIWFLDVLSCWPFTLKKMEYLTEAMGWIEAAMKLNPEAITLQGTYGALLYESGDLEKAETVLHEVLQVSKAQVDMGIGAFYMALLAKKKGDWSEAGRWLRQAVEHYQEPWMLERADLEFSGIPHGVSKKEPEK